MVSSTAPVATEALMTMTTRAIKAVLLSAVVLMLVAAGAAAQETPRMGGDLEDAAHPRSLRRRRAGDSADGRRPQGRLDRRAADARHPGDDHRAHLRDHVARLRAAVHPRPRLESDSDAGRHARGERPRAPLHDHAAPGRE